MLRSRRSGLILHLIDSFDQLSFLYCVLFLSILYLHFLFYLCFVCVFFLILDIIFDSPWLDVCKENFQSIFWPGFGFLGWHRRNSLLGFCENSLGKHSLWNSLGSGEKRAEPATLGDKSIDSRFIFVSYHLQQNLEEVPWRISMAYETKFSGNCNTSS